MPATRQTLCAFDESKVLWTTCLALALLGIFFLSSIPGSVVPYQPSWYIFFERKGAHFFEYSVLVMLWLKVLWVWWRGSTRLWLVAGFGATVVSAVLDELHQYFVPGRGALLTDVGIDILGATFGFALLLFTHFLFWYSRKKITNSNNPPED